jgi:hypothetical protein
MTDIHEGQAHTALGDVARTLANATKTVPMLSTITPDGWSICCNETPEAGIYRVNKVKNETTFMCFPS